MEFFATSYGIPVHINDSKGEGPVLLLLHGYMETLYIFNEFAEQMEKNFRVISFDAPGHGLSGSNPQINTIDFSGSVALDVLRICSVTGKVYIAGHSMGGYISLAATKLYLADPERYSFTLAGLVLLNSNPYSDSQQRKDERIDEIRMLGEDKLCDMADIGIPRMFHESSLRRLDEKILETVEICQTHDPSGIAASIRGLIERDDYSSFVKEYSPVFPMLFIVGDSDRFCSPSMIDDMQKSFPDVSFRIIPGTGHCSFLENLPLTTAFVRIFAGMKEQE